jgi:hypothetical protein
MNRLPPHTAIFAAAFMFDSRGDTNVKRFTGAFLASVLPD